MAVTNKAKFIDISVYSRNITSIRQEKDFTSHSLGYLDFLGPGISPAVIRFGDASAQEGYYYLYRYRFFDLLRLLGNIKSRNPAIVLFHGFSFPVRFFLLKLFAGKAIRWVVQHHAGEPSANRLKRFIQRVSYSQADGYMFVNTAQAALFVKYGLIKKMKPIFEIMECSTPFRPLDKRENRQRFGIPENRKVLVWVGGLDANKDPLCLVRALKIYRESGQDDFLLYMFFAKSDLLQQVKDYIAANGLENHVILKGKVQNPELEHWFSAADFYVSCSHSEGSGVALAEAMACGCIPVVSNIPSFHYMTDAGRLGVSFKKGSPESLAEAFLRLESLDIPGQGIMAVKLFREKLSFEAIGKKTALMVDQLLGAP